MKIRLLFASVFLAGLLCVAAQDGPPPPPHGHPGPPPGMRGPDGPGGKWGGPGGEFIAEVMMARMSKELNLTQEQTVLMVRRFSELRDQTRELRRQRGELVRQLDALLRSEAPEAEKATLLVKEIQTLDEKLVRERQGVFEAMSEGLDPLQQGKLYLFLDRFEADMRRMAGEARERFRGGRGDGGPRGEGGPRGGGPEGPPHRGPRPPDAPPPAPGEEP